MKSFSHNAARKRLPASEGNSELKKENSEVGKTGVHALDDFRKRKATAELARRCLVGTLADTKRWALDLGISPRLVRMWASGETIIPDCRAKQIILQAQHYRTKGRDFEAAIDEAIEELLVLAYGKGGKQSM